MVAIKIMKIPGVLINWDISKLREDAGGSWENGTKKKRMTYLRGRITYFSCQFSSYSISSHVYLIYFVSHKLLFGDESSTN